MKAEQARRLIGRTVYLNFRTRSGRHVLDDVPVRVVGIVTRTVLLELPNGNQVWWRLGEIRGYYEKPGEITTKGGEHDDRTRSKPKM